MIMTTMSMTTNFQGTLRLSSCDCEIFSSSFRLKTKAARYQKEMERHRESAAEANARADRYFEEGEVLRRQSQALQAQCEAARLEVEELLAARRRFEEQLRSREDEVESLRDLKFELEAKIDSAEAFGEKVRSGQISMGVSSCVTSSLCSYVTMRRRCATS